MNRNIAGEYKVDIDKYPITGLDCPNRAGVRDYSLHFLTG